MKYLVLTLLFFGFISGAEARQRHVAPICDNVDVMRPCAYQPNPFSGAVTMKTTMRRHARVRSGHRHARVRSRHARVARVTSVPRSRPAGLSLAGVVPQLAGKITEIIGTCGSRVVSTIAGHSYYVAGTHRVSQHVNGTAVDVAGNPSCIYSMLHGWPGGYSIDYRRVHHVHISIGGREAGVRFVHGGHRHRHYAHRHHRHRYASRWG